MMDVGMYGNDHAAHTTGYQGPDSMGSNYSYYQNHHHHIHHSHHLNAEPILAYNAATTPNTTPPSTSSNSSAMYHPHLYSPTAAEYGITTSNPSPSDQHSYFESDTAVHPFYSPQSAASDPQGTGMPETHIISSDNGLSYTNLDYMYNHGHHHGGGVGNSVYLHGDDKMSVAPYIHGGSEDNSAQSQHHSAGSAIITTASASAWHSHHHSHHHAGFLDSGSLPTGHQIGLGAMGSLQGQTQLSSMVAGNNGRGSHGITGHNHQDQQQQQQIHGQQQHQPTYKWMQVKRNVPKPQSECVFCFLTNCL